MKKASLIICVATITFYSCQNSEKKAKEAAFEVAGLSLNESDEELTGTFSCDGKSYTGKVSTQYFGDEVKDNFSVLCQEGDGSSSPNFSLLQITFLNEADALNNKNLKLYDGSQLPMTPDSIEPGMFTVNLSGVGQPFGDDNQYSGSDKSGGSISVSGKKIVIKDMRLFTMEGDKSVLINCEIPF